MHGPATSSRAAFAPQQTPRRVAHPAAHTSPPTTPRPTAPARVNKRPQTADPQATRTHSSGTRTACSQHHAQLGPRRGDSRMQTHRVHHGRRSPPMPRALKTVHAIHPISRKVRDARRVRPLAISGLVGATRRHIRRAHAPVSSPALRDAVARCVDRRAPRRCSGCSATSPQP